MQKPRSEEVKEGSKHPGGVSAPCDLGKSPSHQTNSSNNAVLLFATIWTVTCYNTYCVSLHTATRHVQQSLNLLYSYDYSHTAVHSNTPIERSKPTRNKNSRSIWCFSRCGDVAIFGAHSVVVENTIIIRRCGNPARGSLTTKLVITETLSGIETDE